MKKNKISKNWLIKKHRDPFFKQSKIKGYRSRSAFKLIEMNKKFKFIKKNSSLLDLGSCPGGWSQVARKEIIKGKILAVDVRPMEKINNVDFIHGNFCDVNICEKIMFYFNSKIDVVLSDMAANTSGNKALDSYRTGELCISAMNLAKKILSENVVFCPKYLWDRYLVRLTDWQKRALKMLLNINLYRVKKNPKKFIFFVKVF